MFCVKFGTIVRVMIANVRYFSRISGLCLCLTSANQKAPSKVENKVLCYCHKPPDCCVKVENVKT